MIINQAPESQAIVSNVQSTGNFALKASSKAFQILSSSLYANKIKAIIRELSCNAVDSHVAAGKQDVPFTVHLPNSIESWFSIRDYGTGLSKEQVLNLYVTYFDSTKSESNDFIGAMGLGSKSPFSYTDNYSVTAIKDGVKGLYTAYIDDAGMPAIALMTECETDEPSGVEVKFSVNNSNDFYRFEREAEAVYKYFDLKPEIVGRAINVQKAEPIDADLIPGVHYTGRHSIAVMGNIAYPIDIPNSEEVLGELHGLLDCGLEMHFPIGALDFQASREGLSYIPMTVNAIRGKLEDLADALSKIVAEHVEAEPTLWNKKCKLVELRDKQLFKAAAMKYHADNNLDWFATKWHDSQVTVTVEDLHNKFNINMSAFTHNYGKNSTVNPTNENVSQVPGIIERKTMYRMNVVSRVIFVENDTKVGVLERAKNHWRKTSNKFTSANNIVYVLNPSDRKKPIDFKGFYDFIGNPTNIIKASSLIERESDKKLSTGIVKKKTDEETIVELTYGYNSKNRYTQTVNWGRQRALSSFDDKTTYYYLHFSGYDLISEYSTTVNLLFKQVFDHLSLYADKVYAVRKTDIEAVKSLPNWVNFEDYVIDILNKKREIFEVSAVKIEVGNSCFGPILTHELPSEIEDTDIGQLVSNLVKCNNEYRQRYVNDILEQYKLPKIDVADKIQEAVSIIEKYPLLQYIEKYRQIPKDVLVNYVKQCNNAVVVSN